MEIQAPFGIVTGCHAGDKFMVGATLASIRQYCHDVPVCLMVDGDVDVSDLEKEYDLIILRIRELANAEMRDFISGSFHAKHAAMWDGPFEYYLWLDSDAILWGDITDQIQTDLDFQIFWDRVSLSSDVSEVPDWLPHYYFDPHKLKLLDSEFEWRGLPYFCAGVFACRRNVIPYKTYREIESWNKQESGLFSFGDMGMLNYLVHSSSQQGRIRIDMTDLQNIPDYNGSEELKADSEKSGWCFPETITRPRIVHFCGIKPNVFNRKAYSRPFTIARLDHHRCQHSALGAWVRVITEDSMAYIDKIKGRLRRMIGA